MLGSAGSAHAQGFIAPFAGYNFGDDSGCPEITGCDDKRLNAGIALGTMGAVFGFEEEFAYTKDFLGSAPGLESSVLTVMTSMLVSPRLRPIRPYFVVGVGLVRTNVELNAASLFLGGGGDNSFGWNIGGGVLLGGRHVALRGDIRFIHAFEDLELLGYTISDTNLNFGRASLGLMLSF
jgi:opacity protein-like surface antigen